jgi:serine/threonine protein kinase
LQKKEVLLGVGAFSRVFLLDGNAVKVMVPAHKNMCIHESTILHELSNGRHIVRCIDIVHSALDSRLILEDGGVDMLDLLLSGHLGANKKQDLFQQAKSGLSFMHSLKIVHRDIKPENMTVDTHGHLRIIDFGLAIRLDTIDRYCQHLKQASGSSSYACPEMLSGKKYNGYMCDVWSMGIFAFALWYAKFPWVIALPTDNKFSMFAKLSGAACANFHELHNMCNIHDLPLWVRNEIDASLCIDPFTRAWLSPSSSPSPCRKRSIDSI